MTGLMINGALPILAAGMYIQDKTNKLVTLLGLTALINFGVNLILIPKFGIQGAAMAKLLSYLILATSATVLSCKLVKLRLPWGMLAKYLIAGAIMYAVAVEVQIASPVLELVADVGAGAAVYFIVVLSLDAEVRQKALNFVRARLTS
jgi:O-antigen/teichoic acid export membrane protein